jgi:Thioesterase-like superfamily
MAETTESAVELPIEISDRFNILGYPNGGYLARLAAETLASRLAHADLLALHASFIGHPSSGPATARIVDLASTKSLSRAMLSLLQDGEMKAFYVCTFTDFSLTQGATARLSREPVRVTPRSNCVDMQTLDLPAPLLLFSSRFDLRLVLGCLLKTGPSKEAEIEGWIALADGSPTTLPTLALFADAFPPPVFNVVDQSQWGSVPTVEYAVHLKARPAPGPIHARFWTNEVRGGLLGIDGELRDVDGVLVAESRQLAKYRGHVGPD